MITTLSDSLTVGCAQLQQLGSVCSRALPFSTGGGSRPGPEGQGPLWTQQQPGPGGLRAAPWGRRRHAPQEKIAEGGKNLRAEGMQLLLLY